MLASHLQSIGIQYQLSPDVQILEELNTGLNNNYVLLSEGQKFFLKQYRHTDLNKVREIHLVKKYLSEGGIPVVQPLKTTGGETILAVDEKMYALFPFVVGLHQEEGNVSDVAIDSLAQTLAAIHKLSVTKPLVIEDHFKDWQREGFLEKAAAILQVIDNKKELTELDLQMKQAVLMKRELVQANTKVLADFNLPNNTLTHGDYHVYNVFFDANEKVEWVFDLEKAEMAPRVLELIRSMELMNFGGNFDEAHMAKARTYVHAYHKYYPLAEGEFAKGMEVRFIKEFHSLWIEGEMYLKNNERFNRFFPSGFATVLYLKDHLQECIQRLQPEM